MKSTLPIPEIRAYLQQVHLQILSMGYDRKNEWDVSRAMHEVNERNAKVAENILSDRKILKTMATLSF